MAKNGSGQKAQEVYQLPPIAAPTGSDVSPEGHSGRGSDANSEMRAAAKYWRKADYAARPPRHDTCFRRGQTVTAEKDGSKMKKFLASFLLLTGLMTGLYITAAGGLTAL